MKKIKINPNTSPRQEYKHSHDLGMLIGTATSVLRLCSVDESGKRLLLRALREIEDGESEYSKSRIKQLESLAGEFGFEFE